MIAEGDEALHNQLNDKCNDAYGLLYALSMFFSPLLGSNLYLAYGARVSCDTVAIVDFTFATILLIFNCGPQVF